MSIIYFALTQRSSGAKKGLLAARASMGARLEFSSAVVAGIANTGGDEVDWYRLDLLDEVGELVEDSWQLAWEVARSECEPDFSDAIFQKCGPGSSAVLYFSPAAHVLAEAFGAVPCERPSPSNLTLVAGDERACQIHFGRVFARPAIPRFVDTGPSSLGEISQASPLQ